MIQLYPVISGEMPDGRCITTDFDGTMYNFQTGLPVQNSIDDFNGSLIISPATAEGEVLECNFTAIMENNVYLVEVITDLDFSRDELESLRLAVVNGIFELVSPVLEQAEAA